MTRKEHAHILALKKAQVTIDKTIQQQEIKDQQDEEENLLAKVKVRPKTPPYREITRTEKQAEYNKNDKKQLAVILL